MVNNKIPDRRVIRATEYVASNLAERPRLAHVARSVGLEPTYFCKLFHQEIGQTFSSWNRRIRVQRAKELLRGTRLAVSTIALVVGYEDVTTFERNFRKCEELTPREYRSAGLSGAREDTTRIAERITRNAETADHVTIRATTQVSE